MRRTTLALVVVTFASASAVGCSSSSSTDGGGYGLPLGYDFVEVDASPGLLCPVARPQFILCSDKVATLLLAGCSPPLPSAPAIHGAYFACCPVSADPDAGRD